jgi:hypothetical protein
MIIKNIDLSDIGGGLRTGQVNPIGFDLKGVD